MPRFFPKAWISTFRSTIGLGSWRLFKTLDRQCDGGGGGAGNYIFQQDCPSPQQQRGPRTCTGRICGNSERMRSGHLASPIVILWTFCVGHFWLTCKQNASQHFCLICAEDHRGDGQHRQGNYGEGLQFLFGPGLRWWWWLMLTWQDKIMLRMFTYHVFYQFNKIGQLLAVLRLSTSK